MAALAQRGANRGDVARGATPMAGEGEIVGFRWRWARKCTGRDRGARYGVGNERDSGEAWRVHGGQPGEGG